MFPKILHIEDVLPSIKGKDEFVVIERDGYCAIDYLVVKEDTFDGDPILNECRGIKFDTEGNVQARPFHKFFNLGEREQIGDVDWDQPHSASSKMDGSMVHGCMHNAKLVFMTRKGITDIAQDGLRLASPELIGWCRRMIIIERATPIFEYTGPDNRIVVRYDEPKLTLIGLRHLHTGEYMNIRNCNAPDVDLPFHFEVTCIHDFVKMAKALKEEEGYVIRFPKTGHMLKIKADLYVLRHKAKEQFVFEKNVLTLILMNESDDLLPLLTSDEQDKLLRYRGIVIASILRLAMEIEKVIVDNTHLTQKEFFLGPATDHDRRLRGALLYRRGDDEGDTFDLIVKYMLKQCGSSTRVEAMRDLLGTDWKTNKGDESND